MYLFDKGKLLFNVNFISCNTTGSINLLLIPDRYIEKSVYLVCNSKLERNYC